MERYYTTLPMTRSYFPCISIQEMKTLSRPGKGNHNLRQSPNIIEAVDLNKYATGRAL